MQLTLLAQVLWATGFCELVALLLVLIVRRRWQNFPVFTAYITFQVVEAVALYGIHQWGESFCVFLGLLGRSIPRFGATALGGIRTGANRVETYRYMGTRRAEIVSPDGSGRSTGRCGGVLCGESNNTEHLG
jgi:hypothetical protein